MSQFSFFCDSLNLRLFNQEGKHRTFSTLYTSVEECESVSTSQRVWWVACYLQNFICSVETHAEYGTALFTTCVTLFWLFDIVAIIMNFNLFTAVIWKQLQDNSLCFLLCQLFSAFGLPRHEFASLSFLLHCVSHRLGHSSGGRFLRCNQGQEKGLAWHAND